MNRPLWSDDFDMDLPKVIPGALPTLGDLADIVLYTHGVPDRKPESLGRLNHPCVWNSDRTMLAFFGFSNPAKPDFYSADKTIVECTVWEAFRDCWPHGFCMMVECQPVWDTFPMREGFNEIMQDLRGWKKSQQVPTVQRRVLASIGLAAQRLRILAREFAPSIKRLEAVSA